MTQLHLELDPEILTFDEMIAIQEGKLRDAKAIIVKFVTDENGRRLTGPEVEDLVGQLNIAQMRGIFREFSDQIGEALRETLPNAPARKSSRQ